jgi:hypothetical protein
MGSHRTSLVVVKIHVEATRRTTGISDDCFRLYLSKKRSPEKNSVFDHGILQQNGIDHKIHLGKV